MKLRLFSLFLLTISIGRLEAQSRVSISPTYWFNYGFYSYSVHSTYTGLTTPLAGRDVSSSAGLTVRYHFTPQWDVSVGLLYNWNSSRLTEAPNAFVSSPFRSEAIQLPILANYRLTTRRLSPYLSAGGFFNKSQTFTEAAIKVSGVVGIGIDYRVRPGLSIVVQPTGSYLFDKPSGDLLYQYSRYNSYRLGIQAQAVWHF